MKKLGFCIAFLVSCCSSLKTQTPQFAVVKPNGTTSMYSSWTLAYAGATSGDYVYIPGTTIAGTITIDKGIHVFGAGHHPDSTDATGKTIVSGSLTVLGGADGGSFEGVQINGSITLGGTSTKLQNFLVRRCYFSILSFNSNANLDSVPEFCTICESIFGSISGNSNFPPKNILFIRNIITSSLGYLNYCTFENNIFTYGNPTIFASILFTTFKNNIFLSQFPVYNGGNNNNCNNSFYNNLKLNTAVFIEYSGCQNLADEGNISIPNISDIFISYANNGFAYTNNYHLKPSCPGVGAGTDDTDVGIYGTNNPTPEGWVPSNPHIYFKQVDSETGTDGKLHIEVGVRANN